MSSNDSPTPHDPPEASPPGRSRGGTASRSFVGKIKGWPAAMRRQWRMTVLIGGVLLIVLSISGFATWRYVAWRIDTKQLRQDAFVAYDQGEFSRASVLFAEYINRRPEDASALHRLALSRLENSQATKQDLLEATTALQRVLELDPQDMAARRALANVYLRLNFLDEAEQEANFLFNAYPRDTFAFSVLTSIKLRRGAYQEAINLADGVLSGEVLPEQLRDVALLVKSKAYLRQGDLEEALFWAEECVKVSAANLEAQELYLQLSSRLDRPPEEFARHARRLYEQRPDVAMNRVMYASAVQAAAQRAAAQGNGERAQAYRSEAVELLRETASQTLNAVELRLVLEQLEQARASTDVLALLEAQLGRDDAPWVLREFGRRAVLSGEQAKLIAYTDDLDPESAQSSTELLGLRHRVASAWTKRRCRHPGQVAFIPRRTHRTDLGHVPAIRWRGHWRSAASAGSGCFTDP